MRKGINYWSFPGGLDGKKDFKQAVQEAKALKGPVQVSIVKSAAPPVVESLTAIQ